MHFTSLCFLQVNDLDLHARSTKKTTMRTEYTVDQIVATLSTLPNSKYTVLHFHLICHLILPAIVHAVTRRSIFI